MKKLILFLSTLFLSVLLAGCISIPLGDGGKLEVSKDGVNIDNGEEKQPEVEEVETPEEADVPEVEEEPEVLEDEGAVEEPEATETNTGGVATGTESCEEPNEDPRGNERAIKQLVALAPPNFPILDCMNVNAVNESYSTTYEAVIVESNFVVEGYWADIHDLYEEYLEESGFGPLEKKEEAKRMSANLRGKTPDYDATLYFDQVKRDDDVELVKVTFTLYHYDAPQEQ